MIFLIEKYLKCGIYKIENIVNKQFYIGSTTGLFLNRYFAHKTKLKYNRHCNSYLQNAWNKYGEKNFVFSLIEQCEKEDCLKREQYYIDTLNPSYNILKIAGSFLGYKHTQYAKNKISLAFRGKNHPAYSGEYVFYHEQFGFAKLGIVDFSERYNIIKSAAHKLKNGVINKYNGWIYIGKWNKNFKYPDSIDKIYKEKIDNRPYYAFYNNIYGKEISHIKEFCEKYKVKRCNIKRLLENNNGSCSINGWICFGKVNKNFNFPDNVEEIYFKTLKKNKRIKYL